MRKRVVFLGLLVFTLTPVQNSFAENWIVDRVSGRAWALEVGKEPVRLTAKMAVPEGVTIETSWTGRVRLVEDKNVMTFAPSTVAVVAPSRSDSRTRVVQQVGSVEFEVEKRGRPHFSVETPYMAAVVKGTTFTVDVSDVATSIDVADGLVEVRDPISGQRAAIGAGQSASVDASRTGLATAGINAPTVTPGRPVAPTVAPLGRDLSSFRDEAQNGPKSDRGSNQSQGRSAAARGDDVGNGGGNYNNGGNGFGYGFGGGNAGGNGHGNAGGNGNGNVGGNGNGNVGGNGHGNAGGNGHGNAGGNGHGNAGGNGHGNAGGNGNGNVGGNGNGNVGGNGNGNVGGNGNGNVGGNGNG
ncbi:FecR domain-containing protein, partial [Aurantimonas sp. A2-1-M11]|uniref:FecR domain-containing protein n=1 Tax=Aurantimonas sp. A2-1-M11 TaxID=3113712 RepID=UPI002F955554